jgi:hypothetical protein
MVEEQGDRRESIACVCVLCVTCVCACACCDMCVAYGGDVCVWCVCGGVAVLCRGRGEGVVVVVVCCCSERGVVCVCVLWW